MKRSIRCAVTCRDSNGTPSIFRCTVEVSQAQYDDEHHYVFAEDKALDAGYRDCGLVYDENDGPDYLFAPEYPASVYLEDTYVIEFSEAELEELGALGCPSFHIVNAPPPLRFSRSDWMLVAQLLIGKASHIRRGFYDSGEDKVEVNDPDWPQLLETIADKIHRFLLAWEEEEPTYADLLDDGIKGGEGG